MKLISYEVTKVVSLFSAARLDGQLYLPQAVREVVQRYHFAGIPKTFDELTNDKVSFKQGLFEGCALDLDIYNDGIVVSSKSASDVLDAFVQDICTWMDDTFGMKRVETHAVNKLYESNLIVHTDAPILSFVERLAPLQDMMGRMLAKATKMEVKFEPVGLSLSPDLSQIATLKPAPFRFERRAQLSFDTNYYYSVAPLPTTDHMKVLREMQKLATS